jgi:uncharacterized protein DUF4190
MTQDDARRGDPDTPPPPPGGEGPGQQHGAPPGWGAPPGYGPPSGYGGQPGYGFQPGYGAQPGYGPPGPWPPPGYGYPPPTNTLAILALVMAFVFSPVGLVLGVVARRQIRETHEQGDGLALAGIIVGGIGTALVVLAFLVFVLALVAAGQSFAP